MQRMLLGAILALASLTVLPGGVQAQAAFTNKEIEWNLQTHAPRLPFDGETYTQRYAYGIGWFAPLMFGASSAQLWEAYYIDRIERARMFGYELPAGLNGGIMPGPQPRQLGLWWRRLRGTAD